MGEEVVMDTLEIQTMRDRIKQFDDLTKQLRYCNEAIGLLEKPALGYELYLQYQGYTYTMPSGPYDVMLAFKEILIDPRDRIEREIKLL